MNTRRHYCAQETLHWREKNSTSQRISLSLNIVVKMKRRWRRDNIDGIIFEERAVDV